MADTSYESLRLNTAYQKYFSALDKPEGQLSPEYIARLTEELKQAQRAAGERESSAGQRLSSYQQAYQQQLKQGQDTSSIQAKISEATSQYQQFRQEQSAVGALSKEFIGLRTKLGGEVPDAPKTAYHHGDAAFRLQEYEGERKAASMLPVGGYVVTKDTGEQVIRFEGGRPDIQYRPPTSQLPLELAQGTVMPGYTPFEQIQRGEGTTSARLSGVEKLSREGSLLLPGTSSAASLLAASSAAKQVEVKIGGYDYSYDPASGLLSRYTKEGTRIERPLYDEMSARNVLGEAVQRGYLLQGKGDTLEYAPGVPQSIKDSISKALSASGYEVKASAAGLQVIQKEYSFAGTSQAPSAAPAGSYIQYQGQPYKLEGSSGQYANLTPVDVYGNTTGKTQKVALADLYAESGGLRQSLSGNYLLSTSQGLSISRQAQPVSSSGLTDTSMWQLSGKNVVESIKPSKTWSQLVTEKYKDSLQYVPNIPYTLYISYGKEEPKAKEPTAYEKEVSKGFFEGTIANLARGIYAQDISKYPLEYAEKIEKALPQKIPGAGAFGLDVNTWQLKYVEPTIGQVAAAPLRGVAAYEQGIQGALKAGVAATGLQAAVQASALQSAGFKISPQAKGEILAVYLSSPQSLAQIPGTAALVIGGAAEALIGHPKGLPPQTEEKLVVREAYARPSGQNYIPTQSGEASARFAKPFAEDTRYGRMIISEPSEPTVISGAGKGMVITDKGIAGYSTYREGTDAYAAKSITDTGKYLYQQYRQLTGAPGATAIVPYGEGIRGAVQATTITLPKEQFTFKAGEAATFFLGGAIAQDIGNLASGRPIGENAVGAGLGGVMFYASGQAVAKTLSMPKAMTAEQIAKAGQPEQIISYEGGVPIKDLQTGKTAGYDFTQSQPSYSFVRARSPVAEGVTPSDIVPTSYFGKPATPPLSLPAPEKFATYTGTEPPPALRPSAVGLKDIIPWETQGVPAGKQYGYQSLTPTPTKQNPFIMPTGQIPYNIYGQADIMARTFPGRSENEISTISGKLPALGISKKDLEYYNPWLEYLKSYKDKTPTVYYNEKFESGMAKAGEAGNLEKYGQFQTRAQQEYQGKYGLAIRKPQQLMEYEYQRQVYPPGEGKGLAGVYQEITKSEPLRYAEPFGRTGYPGIGRTAPSPLITIIQAPRETTLIEIPKPATVQEQQTTVPVPQAQAIPLQGFLLQQQPAQQLMQITPQVPIQQQDVFNIAITQQIPTSETSITGLSRPVITSPPPSGGFPGIRGSFLGGLGDMEGYGAPKREKGYKPSITAGFFGIKQKKGKNPINEVFTGSEVRGLV